MTSLPIITENTAIPASTTPPGSPGSPDSTLLPISETFVSVQGEGLLTGVPSVFIRMSGCNLRCAWCDTPYASWAPEGTRRSIADLVAEARAARVGHAVITGGEPMLFDAVEPLCAALRAAAIHITIETAGTIARPPTRLACDLMSISPKLASSTPRNDPRDPTGVWAERHESRRLNIPALNTLITEYDHQLKFVVSTTADLAEIEALLSRLPAVSPTRVLLMPEGTAPPTAEVRQWLVRECVARNWRYCTRLHIDLFGHLRGT
ncbi:MAG: 7-carboxy-7-deazaguanine synthase QueE [Phycisphaerales bacterium]|jgi:7-carboxy-7-deazaguanine synthase|nr:7-carboxy-7-deazaguanine synthase QueE [Phycisphaeraceae bacterium]